MGESDRLTHCRPRTNRLPQEVDSRPRPRPRPTDNVKLEELAQRPLKMGDGYELASTIFSHLSPGEALGNSQDGPPSLGRLGCGSGNTSVMSTTGNEPYVKIQTSVPVSDNYSLGFVSSLGTSSRITLQPLMPCLWTANLPNYHRRNGRFSLDTSTLSWSSRTLYSMVQKNCHSSSSDAQSNRLDVCCSQWQLRKHVCIFYYYKNPNPICKRRGGRWQV